MDEETRRRMAIFQADAGYGPLEMPQPKPQPAAKSRDAVLTAVVWLLAICVPAGLAIVAVDVFREMCVK